MKCEACSGSGAIDNPAFGGTRMCRECRGSGYKPELLRARLGDRVFYTPHPDDPVPAGGPFLALVVGLWPEGQAELEVFVPTAVAVSAVRTFCKNNGLSPSLEALPRLLRWRRDGVSMGPGPGYWAPLEKP